MNQDADITKFQALKDFSFPPTPAEDKVVSATKKILNHFISNNDDVPVEATKLRSIREKRLKQVAPPPAYASLITELENTVLPWWQNDDPSQWVQPVVVPPGDATNFIAAWAHQNENIHILPPPARANLLKPSELVMPELVETGTLTVIPRLEDWFLRHENGLSHIRWLFDYLASVETHFILGCNSWAWSYLTKILKADMVLGGPITFKAFDEARLATWLSGIVDERGRKIEFRHSKSGGNIFVRDEKGNLKYDHMKLLAAKSLGIPWVAWTIWRESLMRERAQAHEDNSEQEDASEHALVLWLDTFENYALPSTKSDHSLHILHALLLHNGLHADEIDLVLPESGWAFSMTALVNSRIVVREDDFYYCNPAAYTAVRTAMTGGALPRGDI